MMHRCESSGGSSLEFVRSDGGQDPLGVVVGGPFEGRLKDMMTPKLRLQLEERLDAMVTRILRERGLEPHSSNLLPSGSNGSFVEGMDTSLLHTQAFLEQEKDT